MRFRRPNRFRRRCNYADHGCGIIAYDVSRRVFQGIRRDVEDRGRRRYRAGPFRVDGPFGLVRRSRASRRGDAQNLQLAGLHRGQPQSGAKGVHIGWIDGAVFHQGDGLILPRGARVPKRRQVVNGGEIVGRNQVVIVAAERYVGIRDRVRELPFARFPVAPGAAALVIGRVGGEIVELWIPAMAGARAAGMRGSCERAQCTCPFTT